MSALGIAVIGVLLLMVLPFEVWSLDLDDEQRYRLLRWAYIHLPRRYSKKLLPLYWEYAYRHSDMRFWSRCFPNERHNWVYIGTGIHCSDCGGYIPNYKLSKGLFTYPVADNYTDVLL